MFEYSVQFMINGQWGSCYPCFGKNKQSALASLIRRVGYPYGSADMVRVRDEQEACYWMAFRKRNKHSKRQWYKIDRGNLNAMV